MIKKAISYLKTIFPHSLNRGVTIAELAISITIISVIAGSAISVAVHDTRQTKTSQTEAKMSRIEEALVGFVSMHNRLPCPADITLKITDTNFGMEKRSSTDNSDCDASLESAQANPVYGGAVPVRTLQLPDNFAFDGWDRRVFYYTVRSYANNKLTNSACSSTHSDECFSGVRKHALNWVPRRLYVYTYRTNAGSHAPEPQAYALVSTGEDGHGAYPKDGGTARLSSPLSTDPNRDFTKQNRNAALDAGNIGMIYSQTYTNKPTEYFDDILRYKDKFSIVYDTGAKFSSGYCDIAQTIVNDSGNSICDGLGLDPSGAASPKDNVINTADEKRCVLIASALLQYCTM